MDKKIIEKVSNILVNSGSTFRPDKINAHKKAIMEEENQLAKWTMDKILENALIAQQKKCPLCDDTGIPHLVLDVGFNKSVSGYMLESIKEGVRVGLRKLPGRPMAIKGNESQRLDQSLGLYEDSGSVDNAPILIRSIPEDVIRLHIMMFGGGPEIRAKTYRIFHKHNVDILINEIVDWAIESTKMLGCTPCTLAIGIGRSHYEATALMLESLIEGSYDKQSELENKITNLVNEKGVGPLGFGGKTTVLKTFLMVGPQRASGVRIVCLRPCCNVEPRIDTVEL